MYVNPITTTIHDNKIKKQKNNRSWKERKPSTIIYWIIELLMVFYFGIIEQNVYGKKVYSFCIHLNKTTLLRTTTNW